MGWLTTIINVITAIPKILSLVGQLIQTWREMAADRKEENTKDEIEKEHDDLRSGRTPRG